MFPLHDKVLMAAGDTFRAAARDQLEVWAKRTNSEIVIIKGENVKPTVGNHDSI